MYAGWFLVILLLVFAPVAVLAAVAWLVTFLARPPEETAARIAKERFVRGEIDKEQLGVLMHAL